MAKRVMEHRIEVTKATVKSHAWFQPSCKCGWVGHSCSGRALAEREGDGHVLAVLESEEE